MKSAGTEQHQRIDHPQDRIAPTAVTNDVGDYYERGSQSIRSVSDAGILEEYSEKLAAPSRRRFYRNKKYWLICSAITIVIVVVVVLLIIFVFFPMIAQNIMNQSGIDVEGAQISFKPPDNLASQKQQAYDMNQTFFMSMSNKLSNTGPFSATITFHNPIEVYYNETILGTIELPQTHVSGGNGRINATTPFFINNTEYFAAFAKDMLAAKTFKWNLKGKLEIAALSRTATVNLDKDIYMDGMNGFPEVKITSFGLPGDAPQGGIAVQLGTALTSPSPIGIQLGTIVLQMFYQGVNLGQVSSQNVALQKGENDIQLNGVLAPQTDPNALAKISQLFSDYVAGKMSQTLAVGISCAPDGINAIGWLSEGFKSVQLNVALGLDQPLNIIQAVSLGYMDMQFSTVAPYAPVTSAPNVHAAFTIPFGFTLNITQVSQELQLSTNATGAFASLYVPWVACQADQKAGTMQFAMSNVPIQAIAGKEPLFDDFTYALTASSNYTFQILGNVSTVAMTPIGQVILSGIHINVPTTLNGLQFLNSTPTTVNSVDVTGGTADDLLLAINVSMTNPSDFSISSGDVNFEFLASGEQLGNVLLNNLTLVRGANQITAQSTFNPKASQVGQNLLSTFVMGQTNAVNIAGFSGSTAISSLIKAFSAIAIDTNLPGLQQQLVQGAKLTVNPDSPTTGNVNIQVSLENPFTAGLSVTKVVSSASYLGLPVGNIDQDISNSPLVVGGHAVGTSNPLTMNMNVEPAAVALLLRELAVNSNLDTRALDALLTMGGVSIAGQEQVSGDTNLFNKFNISQYVVQAMQALKVDLQLLSTINIGQYTTDLQFAQNNVTVQTDNSVTLLIPIVGQPIVQQLVDGSVLSFDTIVLSSPTDSSFQVNMKGGISNTGPFSAQISFPAPLNISWQGRTLGSLSMPVIQTQPNAGAQFDITASFSIADQGAMGDFAGYLINNADFDWEITTSNVAVTALGYTFTGITMDKFVTLAGANGFKDAVKITSFNLPSNDPQGGVTLIANTTIYNPSQVGFSLSGAGFTAYFKDVHLGPMASDGNAEFPPKGTANINMKGRLVPQETKEGLAAVTEMFGNFLSAKDSLLEVKGESGSGPNGQVGWLTAGFKTLDIKDVVLPGPDTPPTLIPAVTMKDMELDFTKDAWAPPVGSNVVEAQLQSPFGFPIGVTQLDMDVIVYYGGKHIAELKVPENSATTSPTGLVTTHFSDVPFKVFGDAHDNFATFVKDLTTGSNVTFELAGTTNAVTQTAIGNLNLGKIEFDVNTALAGFNNFGESTQILDMDITGATKEYIVVKLTISLNNPSQITITLGDMMLTTIMNEFSASVGSVYLKGVTIKPGSNTLDAEMHLQSSNDQAIRQMLSNFMTNAVVPLTVLGSEQSSSIEPLKQGLSTVKLATSMHGIPNILVTGTVVYGELVSDFLAGKAQTKVTLQNVLNTPFTIKEIHVSIVGHTQIGLYPLGTIDYSLPSPFTVPARGQATSDWWPVALTPLNGENIGALVNFLLSADPRIDLTQNATIVVGDGFESVLYYYQNNVSATIQIPGVNALAGLLSPSANATTTAASATVSASASSSVPAITSASDGTQATATDSVTATATSRSSPTPSTGSTGDNNASDGNSGGPQSASTTSFPTEAAPASSVPTLAPEEALQYLRSLNIDIAPFLST